MIHTKVADIIREHTPNVVVLERFNLYPGMAKHLSWNSFYPCEVIGVIKYVSATFGIKVIEQAPGVKKFSGGLQETGKSLKRGLQEWLQSTQRTRTCTISTTSGIRSREGKALGRR